MVAAFVGRHGTLPVAPMAARLRLPRGCRITLQRRASLPFRRSARDRRDRAAWVRGRLRRRWGGAPR